MNNQISYFTGRPDLSSLLKVVLNSILNDYSIFRAERNGDGEIDGFQLLYENNLRNDTYTDLNDRLRYILKKSLANEDAGTWSSTQDGLVFPLTSDEVLLVKHDGPVHQPDEIKMQLLLGIERAGEVVDHVVLNKAISQAIFELNRTGQPFVLGMINIDDFNSLDHIFGVEISDEVLDKFSMAILNKLGPSDSLISLDGNSFALVLQGERNLSGFLNLFEELSQTAGRGIKIEDEVINIEFSAGYVLVQQPNASISEVSALAESLMYRIKNLGKNGYMTMSINQRMDAGRAIAIRGDRQLQVFGK